LDSQAANRRGESQSAASWLSKRVRKARLTGESMSVNIPIAAGKNPAPRGWFAMATRWATRSFRVRQLLRRVRVAWLSGVSGRSRDRSVCSVSASTKALKRSSLLPARAVARSQILQLVWADHHYGQARCQQRIDHRPVGTFDRHLGNAASLELTGQPGQSGIGMDDLEPFDLTASDVDDRDGMVLASPVDPAGQPLRWCFWQNGWGKLHNDGSVDVFVGRAAQAGFETKRVKSVPAKRVVPIPSLRPIRTLLRPKLATS
jgi:hypothetical protein